MYSKIRNSMTSKWFRARCLHPMTREPPFLNRRDPRLRPRLSGSLIATTLILFVALEVVYRMSNKHGGIAEVTTEGYSQYLWLYLPALAMAGLGLASGSMDIAARTIHPFSELSRGRPAKMDVMRFDPRSSTALVAVAQTLR
jgi:hypothetical protein